MAMSNAERQKAYRERKKAEKVAAKGQEPVFVHQVPPPCVVEGNPDDLPPVKIEQETLTYFDVYKRRHDGMFK